MQPTNQATRAAPDFAKDSPEWALNRVRKLAGNGSDHALGWPIGFGSAGLVSVGTGGVR